MPLARSLLLGVSIAISLGCARIYFRQGMEEIQRERIRLHDYVELGRVDDARESATRLDELFRSPEIASGPFAEDPLFDHHRARALDILAAFRSESETDAASAALAYSRLTGACQSCHDALAR